MLRIRSAEPGDAEAIWAVLEPVIRGGETYALPREMSRADAIAYWCARGNEVFVAEFDGQVIGTYFLRTNQLARTCRETRIPGNAVQLRREHQRQGGASLAASTSTFVGRLPGAFLHPTHGYVDVYVMYRKPERHRPHFSGVV